MLSSGTTESLWMQRSGLPTTSELNEDLVCDVLILGAGIAGLTTAYQLCRAGRDVVVLDHAAVGGGETSRTTAHLSNAIDDRYTLLERIRGEEPAHLAARAHTAAIDRIEAIAREEAIDCEFRRLDGYLFLAPGDSPEHLKDELAAAGRAGVEVEMVDRAPLWDFDTGPALRFARQGQVSPMAYLRGLLRCVQRDGGRVFTGTHAQTITEEPSIRVTTAGDRTVSANWLVVATNSPINDRYTMHSKLAPHRTYAFSADIAPDAVDHALLWDTADPYHYVRTSGEGEEAQLIVGGADHRTGQHRDGRDRWQRLETWARERFGAMGRVRTRWSGQVLETLDGLAYIGRNPSSPENVLIVTGDSGMGMTHGTIAGMLLGDLVLHKPNPWVGLFDPARKPIAAARQYVKHNLHVTAQYAHWLGSGEVDSAADIPPDSGAVVRRGMHRVAVYRDPEGACHEFSAVCPHLKCSVSWNPTEHTWDCACHGSRFDAYGHAITGPTHHNLHPAHEERQRRAAS